MVIPSSHQKGYLYPQHEHNNEEKLDFARESFGFDDEEAVPVEMKAGDVVYFNGYLYIVHLRTEVMFIDVCW